MKKIIKIGIRCISMFLVLNLIVLNNALAVDLEIDITKLIGEFRKRGAPKEDRFEEHLSYDEAFFGKVLKYVQPGTRSKISGTQTE